METDLPLPEVTNRQLKKLRNDPRRTAELAGLNYVDGTEATGYYRLKKGRGFCYVDQEGVPCRNRRVLERIKGLVVPPAWRAVWICADPRGHLQATGVDLAGRKQYRYHAHWNQIRNKTKYFRLLAFSEVLPDLRQSIEKDLRKLTIDQSKTIALIMKLMEKTAIRVGNERYRSLNGSVGITTLDARHVSVRGKTIRFRFKGKKGVKHDIVLKDERLSRLILRFKAVKGRRLFKFQDVNGVMHPVNASQINAYIQEHTGGRYSSKDFRTWIGTVSAYEFLSKQPVPTSQADLKRKINACLDVVAATLGNTRAVCRKYYVHPAVVGAYEMGKLHCVKEVDWIEGNALSANEVAVTCLLKSRLRR